MAQYAVSITKRVSFRGVQQHFSNVYHYAGDTLQEDGHNALLDRLVEIEKQFHTTAVTYTQGRVWTSGGLPSENVTVLIRNLSGSGMGLENIAGFDRERAVLIRFPAGLSITNKPVYLRKWFHSCGNPYQCTFTVANLQNTEMISETNRNQINLFAGELQPLIIPGRNPYTLIAESGRAAQGPGQCHQWLEHRQLGDEWR